MELGGGVQAELSARHRAILQAVGLHGADEGSLGALARSREFDDLTHGGLVTFWHPLAVHRPEVTGGRPGAWCLTESGAAALELPPVRFA